MDELDAVMMSIDKWFDEGDERLKDNPATRAAHAREIALQAIETAQPSPDEAVEPVEAWSKEDRNAFCAALTNVMNDLKRHRKPLYIGESSFSELERTHSAALKELTNVK